ncbi:hypothetical protein ABIB81_003071 [Bradyrhizobium sp. I1.7.5]
MPAALAGWLRSFTPIPAWEADEPNCACDLLTRSVVTSVAIRSADGAEEFKTIAIFCGPGLLLSLVAAMLYGLDLTAFDAPSGRGR